MQVSVVLPQQDIGFDGAKLREWARALEALGIDEIEAYDHVIGGDPSRWSDGPPRGYSSVPFTIADQFHEPLMLFSHLAAVTTHMGFATSVMVLPQRQTALVAKQCAELDRLSEGRLRLGVGIGWNHVEYEALGQDFASRGKRLDEQVAILRALWAEPVVSYDGSFDHLDRAGINPLPSGLSIPIWIGGVSDKAFERVVRYGDGWVLNVTPPDSTVEAAVKRLTDALAAAGRPRNAVGVSGWIRLVGRSPAEWADDAVRWRALSVDRVGLITLGAGAGPEPHLALVERFLDKTATILR